MSGIDLIVVFVIGFFGALDPRGYREGLLLLVPEEHRAQARRLSIAVVATLRSWLLGQMIPMAAIGVASMISLWILGVHLAFTVGLLTGIMIFIPYLGTVVPGILAILLALQRSPRTALYVFVLYAIFHTAEGYFLTPMVQRRAVRLPPILTILAQLCLGSFAGILGGGCCSNRSSGAGPDQERLSKGSILHLLRANLHNHDRHHFSMSAT